MLDRLVRELGGVASQDFFPVRPIDTTPELMGSLLRLGRQADAWAAGLGLNGPVGPPGLLQAPPVGSPSSHTVFISVSAGSNPVVHLKEQ